MNKEPAACNAKSPSCTKNHLMLYKEPTPTYAQIKPQRTNPPLYEEPAPAAQRTSPNCKQNQNSAVHTKSHRIPPVVQRTDQLCKEQASAVRRTNPCFSKQLTSCTKTTVQKNQPSAAQRTVPHCTKTITVIGASSFLHKKTSYRAVHRNSPQMYKRTSPLLCEEPATAFQTTSSLLYTGSAPS